MTVKLTTGFWRQHDRFITPSDCFLHNKPILMGYRLTVVPQQDVLTVTGRNLHSVISDHQTWQLDIVVACWGFSLHVKQVVLENGSQNIPKASRLQRKWQVIKLAFRCRRGNDSKYVTMGYMGYYLISSVAVQWGGLCAWCLQMDELLAQEWDHPERTRVLFFQLFRFLSNCSQDMADTFLQGHTQWCCRTTYNLFLWAEMGKKKKIETLEWEIYLCKREDTKD